MSVLLTDEADRVVDTSPDEADRVVDTSSDFNQTALHTHEAEHGSHDCIACHASKTAAHYDGPGGHLAFSEPLPFVPPSQGARIAELTRRVAQQEGDLNQACRRIAEQGQTIRMVRRDLLDLLSKAKAGVEITFYDIANIIPDEPAANVPEFLKAA